MILLIAGGHGEYGKLASNLIYSIRANSEVPIHVLTHGEAALYLPDVSNMTTSIIPKEAMNVRGRENFFFTKTWIYDLTPFESTLFLDVDMVLFKSIDPLLSELASIDWTIQNRAKLDLSENVDPKKEKNHYLWASYNEIKSKYKGFLYSLHSECIWFKKSQENKEYFDLVKELYTNPPVTPRTFAGDVADELAFALACNILDKKPHLEPFVPVYWWMLDGKKDGYELQNLGSKYYGFSVGGNRFAKRKIEDNYNTLARTHCKKFGKQEYRLIPKYKVLKERQVM